MTPRNHLHIVADGPCDIDLYARWRDDIRARDWDAVHIAGDRRSPVELPAVRRGWR